MPFLEALSDIVSHSTCAELCSRAPSTIGSMMPMAGLLCERLEVKSHSNNLSFEVDNNVWLNLTESVDAYHNLWLFLEAESPPPAAIRLSTSSHYIHH